MSTRVAHHAAESLAADLNRQGLVAYLLDPDGRTLAGPVTATAVGHGGDSFGLDVYTDKPLRCHGPGVAWEIAVYSPAGRLMSYPIDAPAVEGSEFSVY
jgi:hypothetical protein